MLNVKLLGHTSISYKNENLTNDLGKKTIALLFLLVVNEGKYITKDKLAVYLWPESNEESSKYNVRYNLWMLNKIIPEDKNGNELIITDVNSCTLNKEYSLNCDLLSIMKCEYENAKIEELSEVVDKAFSGDVMEGWFFNKCYDFNELILMYRMQIENKQMKILKSLSRKYYEKEQFNKALAVLKKAEQFDPNNETVAIWTLKTYSALGERVAGINYYKIFESRLWKDLNIMPNDELQSLYENLFDTNLPYDIAENPEEKTNLQDLSLFTVLAYQV
ncbi:MAG: BTAD domain-containing putative transcriptional regulator [Prolixibacteraceae bacterium]|nr:BTAD domain-containing putative transcriptional regulator [Prolixibacteraceae bacterium]